MLEKGTKVFGDWTIDEHIGSGAFGAVYKIRREEFEDVYYAALKVINIPQDPQDQLRLRSEGLDNDSINTYYGQIAKNFLQEIKLLSSLDGNTNIVDYKDHSVVKNGDLGYTIYIRMQLLTPLNKKLVNAEGNAVFMDTKDILALGIDMCSALELCERHKIIHRDIKIDNIFKSASGDYKLGDFGIAKQLEATQGEMSKKGTMMYMAPEVFRGENYNNTADIYSLGIVLYRLLNKNRSPFFPAYPETIRFSDKETANLKRLSGAELPAINGVSDELMRVLRKACAFKPENRYSTATEFRRDLKRIFKTGDLHNDESVAAEEPECDLSGSVDANSGESNDIFRDATINAISLEETSKHESVSFDPTEKTASVFGGFVDNGDITDENYFEPPVFDNVTEKTESIFCEKIEIDNNSEDTLKDNTVKQAYDETEKTVSLFSESNISETHFTAGVENNKPFDSKDTEIILFDEAINADSLKKSSTLLKNNGKEWNNIFIFVNSLIVITLVGFLFVRKYASFKFFAIYAPLIVNILNFAVIYFKSKAIKLKITDDKSKNEATRFKRKIKNLQIINILCILILFVAAVFCFLNIGGRIFFIISLIILTVNAICVVLDIMNNKNLVIFSKNK